MEERAELLSHLHIAVALREGAAGDLGGALGNGVVGGLRDRADTRIVRWVVSYPNLHKTGFTNNIDMATALIWVTLQ